MAGIEETRTYNALLTTTLANYRKQLIDNIFDDYPFLSWINGKLGRAMRGSNDSVKRTIDGGETIVEHLLFGQNSTVDSYAGYEVLDVTPQEGMTIGRYNWKQYSGSITISGLEERSNKGEAKMIDLLEAKAKQTEMSLRDRLSRDSFADGTGNGGKNLTGLSLLVSDTATAGGINPSTQPWWKSDVTSSVGSFAANGVDSMRTAFNNVTFGNDKPDIIFCTQDVIEFYEKTLQPILRLSSNKVADAGFENFLYKNVPIIFDRDCPTGLMYMLNSRYLSYVVHQDADFKTGEFIKPENQDAKTANILLQANLTTNNRRKLAVLQSITA
ncbi:MAG: phage major capsid protein [Candidatus Peribacteraceae bacterium]|nr:phage major capsid protein [Candidatus Peribacteraceae bacterium]